MKKATYTPGPWRIDQFGVVLGSNGEFIAEIFGPDEDNFDLIVSAPELYEALNYTAQLLEALGGTALMARAALSRARGEG